MAEYADYRSSAFSVDNVIFGFDEADLKVLLIKRGAQPFHGMWALPGDLVHSDEDLDVSCARVLEELTGLKNVYLEQVATFGKVGRHPMGRVITIAYYSLVKISDYTVTPASFAQRAKWHSVAKIEDLAFDHKEILDACYAKLKRRVRTQPIGFELLPPRFTLTEIQHLYEAILEEDIEKRNFRKKILAMDFVIDSQESQEGVAHRPARLYEFNSVHYKQLVAEGFNFKL